jgi:uncharacterized membrane protein YgcG
MQPNILSSIIFKPKLMQQRIFNKLALKKLLLLSLIICSILFSCKKNDIEVTNFHDQNFVEKFFYTKTKPPQVVEDIIDKLKQENERTGFVSKLPKNCGVPVWEKIVIQKHAKHDEMFEGPAKHGPSASFETFEEESNVNIIIPLSINNSNLSSIIVVEDLYNATIINCYTTNDYLYNVAHGAMIDTSLAMQKLALFFYMENRTYGTTKFYHIPANLFLNSTTLDADGNKTITIDDDTTTSNVAPIVWICIDYLCSVCYGNDPECPLGGRWTICTPIGGGSGGGAGGGGTGGGGTGGGGGGGTGGGGGGSTCPFAATSWYNLIPPEPCDDPPPPPQPSPCSLANLAAKKMDTLYMKCKVDSVLNTIPNISTEPLEKGFAMIKKKETYPYDPNIFTFTNHYCNYVQTGTDSSITIEANLGYREHVAGFFHTHPNSGYTAQSAKDIYSLIEGSAANPYLEGNMIKAYDESQYAVTISNPTLATGFLQTKTQYLSGSKWNENSEIGKAFKDAEDYYKTKVFKNNPNKNNLAFEMAMSAVLKQFNTGITLFKKNTSGKFEPLIVTTSTPDPTKPKKKVYTQDCILILEH